MSKIETYLALAVNHKDDEIIYHAALDAVKIAIKDDSEFANKMRVKLRRYIQSLEEEQLIYKKRYFKEMREKEAMIKELDHAERSIEDGYL